MPVIGFLECIALLFAVSAAPQAAKGSWRLCDGDAVVSELGSGVFDSVSLRVCEATSPAPQSTWASGAFERAESGALLTLSSHGSAVVFWGVLELAESVFLFSLWSAERGLAWSRFSWEMKQRGGGGRGKGNMLAYIYRKIEWNWKLLLTTHFA